MTLVQAQQTEWPDGSMGCPEPGSSFTLAPVDGYWVVLDTGSQLLDYRISLKGFFIRCDRQLLVAPPRP